MSVPEQWEVRIGDADRQAMVDELRAHFAAGRLTLEEFEERTELAMAARKRADLVPLVADLPSTKPRSSGPPVRFRQPAPTSTWDVAFRIHFAVWIALSAFFVGLAILTRSGGWPRYPILSIGLTVGLHYAIKIAVHGGERPRS